VRARSSDAGVSFTQRHAVNTPAPNSTAHQRWAMRKRAAWLACPPRRCQPQGEGYGGTRCRSLPKTGATRGGGAIRAAAAAALIPRHPRRSSAVQRAPRINQVVPDAAGAILAMIRGLMNQLFWSSNAAKARTMACKARLGRAVSRMPTKSNEANPRCVCQASR